MARPLFHAGKSVHLLVTILWLRYVATAVLEDVPSPSKPRVTARNETSLTLEWTVPSETNHTVDSFVVRVRGPTRTYNESFPSNGNASSTQTVVLGGLSAGNSYDITVFSNSSSGDLSSGTDLANATTSTSPVANLTLIGRSTTSLTLNWMVPNNTNQGSYRYVVLVGPTRNETFHSEAAGGDMQTGVIGKLSAGVSYDLAVYSLTSNDIPSTWRNLTNQTTSPSPVGDLMVIARNMTTLTLQWTVPNDTNNGTYSYEVQVVSTQTAHNQNIILNSTRETTETLLIEGLLPGVSYNLTVYSRTSDGIMSTAVSVTNQTSPSPVKYLEVIARNDSSLTLRWTVSNDPNNGTYSYEVQVVATQSAHKENFTVNATGGTTETKVIVGLSPGVSYDVTVYSRTADGIMSTAVSVTNQTNPSPVTILEVTARNESSLTLRWTVPDDRNQSSYSYDVWVGPTHHETFKSTAAGGTKMTEVIRDLSPGVSYNVTVYSRTPDGAMSTETSLPNQTTKPSPVTNLTVITRNMTSLTLQWTVPNDTNQKSYSYMVKVRDGPIVVFTLNATGGTQQSVVVGDLFPGDPYDLSVYSVTSDGINSTATSLTNQTTMPSPVTNLTVANRNESSLTLQWKVPADKYQTSYTYVVTVGSRPNATQPSTVTDGNMQTTVITGLDPGFPYNIEVYSVSWNKVESTPTPLVNATTMPSPVTTFSVTNRTETSLSLQWMVPNNTLQITYHYLVKVNTMVAGVTVGDHIFPSNVDLGKNQTYTIPGLTPGIPYNLSIFSVTANNISSVGKDTMNETNPSPVTNVGMRKRTNSSITIAWTVPANILVDEYSYWVKVVNNDTVIKTTVVKKNISVQDDLKAGTLYRFFIQSVTKNNVSSTEKQHIQYSDPNPPENLMGSPSSDTAILVKWTPPQDPNVKNYNYTVILYNTQNAETNHTSNTSANTASFSSLFPGNQYLVSVTSQIADASSTKSQTFAQTNPQAVKRLIPPVLTNTTATFTWDLEKQNNSKLSGFQITVILQNGTTTIHEIDSSLRNYIIGNLIPGTNYTFEFRSMSSSSLSPLTLRRRRQTENALVTYSPAIVLNAQTDPGTATAIICEEKNGGYSLGIRWDCPQGRYTQIKVLVNGKENTATNSCEAVTITKLQPASEYEISVQTIADLKAVTSSSKKCKTDATGVIVGAVFGVLLFLVLIALIVFFVLKHRRTKGGSGSGRPVSMNRFPANIPVDKFPAYFHQQHADSDFGFAEEYQLLVPIGTDQGQTAAQLLDNRPKNRYTNVLPYDISRVKLRSLPSDPNSDYINANYMPGYNSNKEFIATQGPLPSTIGDFWRMVWEHRVGTLVMLTNCTEGGKLKCEHYWPLDYTPCTYDGITVTVTSETILPQWTTREFTLRHAKEPGIRYVSHFHYTVWPDHGVPDETTTVIKFRNMVRDHMDQRKSNGPAVVHCSAGVGRTGTLIAIDYLVQQVENEKVVGVFNFIKKMRLNRPFMVQTESQYIFLNQCMLDYIQRPRIESENIYENQIAGDVIYENFNAINQYGKTSNGKLA